MRKLLSILFVMILAFSVVLVVSCDKNKGNDDDKKTEEQTAELSKGMKAAKNYINALYKDMADLQASDYTLLGEYKPDDTAYTITWTIEIISGVQDGVTAEKSADGKTYTIKNKEKLAEDTVYNLKGVITCGDEKVELTYKHTAPQYKELTWAEYVATEDDAAVVVKGVVTAISSKNHNGNTYNCVYFQDEDGAYYTYGSADDPVDKGIAVGMTIRVTGTRDTYSGTYEIADAGYEIIDSTIKTVTPVDYTEIFKNAASLKDAALVEKQSMLVTIKGVTISDENATNGYYNFELGGKKSYVRISSSVCPISSADQATFKAEHAAKFGWLANVTGVICLYDGAFYLTPVSVDAFEYLSLPEKSDAEAVAFEKDALTIETNVAEEGQIIEVPTAGTSYEKVAIAWALKEENANVAIADGKITATMIDEAYTVTVVATLTCGEVTETKEIEIAVDALSTEKYLPKVVAEAKAGTYKFVTEQVIAGKTLYCDGTVNESEYLGVTEKADKAADFVVVAVEGQEGKYTISVDGKFLEIYENASQKIRFHFVDAATGAWAWNADAKVYTYTLAACAKTTNDGEYYIGTYKTYETLSASLIKYITGDNAANVGESQFPTQPCELAVALEQFNAAEEAKAGTYKFVTEQVIAGKTLYCDGTVNESEYLGVTEKADKAADFVVAAVEGQEGKYTISVDGKFLEIYENASQKIRFHFVDAATGAWAWNADAKVYTYTLVACAKTTNDGEYYIGTYKTYETLSASLIKYITGDNAANVGESQFPTYACTASLVEAELTTQSEPTVGTFKQYVVQNVLGKTLYCDGTIDASEYLAVTEKYAKAADFVVTAVEGQEGKYTISVDGKFLEVYENTSQKIRFHFVDTATGAWEWNADAKVFTYTLAACAKTTNDGTYYIGTYKTYESLSASLIKYITGDNAANVGESQFPAYLGVRAPKAAEEQETPKANVVIDWADGTVGEGYTSANWKQEVYTSQWEEKNDKMNCREKNGTKVVNMYSGWSMEYRYTYSTGESLGLANKLTLVLGNYYNDAQEYGFRVYGETPTGEVVYLVGSADEFVKFHVTAGLETVTYTFADVELVNIKFSCKSAVQGNAYLYFGGIKLTYDIPDADKVAAEKKALEVETTMGSELTLAAKGATYEDVAIAWALKEANEKVTLADGKLTATQSAESYTITLVATITCGEATDTKEFTVTVEELITGAYAALDGTAITTKHQGYADTWTYGKHWTICGGQNNNGDWNYFKFGPKAANIPANQDFYAKTVSALREDATTIEVVIGSDGAAACYNNETEKVEIYIECYSDAAYTQKVGEATAAQEAPAIAKGTAENQTLTFTGNWAKGTYIKVVFKVTNTTTYNGVTCVKSITIK